MSVKESEKPNTQDQDPERDLNQEEQETEDELRKEMERVRKDEKSVRHYQNFLIRLVVLLLVLWVLFFKVIGLSHVPNGDMYPRLDAGDFLLFYRLDRDVRSQDVVLLEKVTPDSNGKKELYCGRVVAVAGDTVDISDSERLIVNGNQVIESNIFYNTPRYEGFTEYPLTLGPGQCFVLVDRREGGSDSRYYGPVEKDEIVGTVISFIRRTNM
jgi:signal peptidase I